MPVESRGTKIVEKATGKVVGHSKTPEAARRAARTRNAIVYGGFKPTRRKPSRSTDRAY